jgi:hypothetical protein
MTAREYGTVLAKAPDAQELRASRSRWFRAGLTTGRVDRHLFGLSMPLSDEASKAALAAGRPSSVPWVRPITVILGCQIGLGLVVALTCALLVIQLRDYALAQAEHGQN